MSVSHSEEINTSTVSRVYTADLPLPPLPDPGDQPRAEHPRPDFRREEWLNLNGRWRFAFDPENAGIEERWFERNPDAFEDEIIVPFPWESHLAWGEGEAATNEEYYHTKVYLDPERVTTETYRTAPRHTVGWYAKKINVPESWKDRRVFLVVGAADWDISVWVNGEALDPKESGYLPVEWDLTPHLQGTECTVVFRVEDPMENRKQPGGKQHDWYQRTSGIWQTVYLEARGCSRIDSAHFEPLVGESSVKGKVRLCTDVPADQNLELRVIVQAPEGEGTQRGFSLTESPVQETLDFKVPIKPLYLWTPETPYLYDVSLELWQGDELIDCVRSYFGMREVSVSHLPGTSTSYVHLNGRPVYLRGALHQSFHPAGIYAYPSDAFIRRDIRLAKALGFNFLRIHIKVDEPRLLYWADREGVLIMADIPNFANGAYSERACELWEKTLRGSVARDFNHPALISWCLFNETWGLASERRRDGKIERDPDWWRQYAQAPDRQDWVRRMWHLAKALDQTRVIEDMSPCHHDHVVTDLNSWHFYINDYKKARHHIDFVARSTEPGSAWNYVGGDRQGGEPLINSEYGGIAARDGDKDVSWSFKFLTNEMRRHEKIAGYVYTELTDLEWEKNGCLKYDRTLKEFGYPVTDLNSGHFLAIDAPPVVDVKSGERVELESVASLFGDEISPGVAFDGVLHAVVEGMDCFGRSVRQSVAQKGVRLTGARVTPMPPLQLKAPETPGLYRLEFALASTAGNRLARNWIHLAVIDRGAGGETQGANTGAKEPVERARPLVPPDTWIWSASYLAYHVSLSACEKDGDWHQVDQDLLVTEKAGRLVADVTLSAPVNPYRRPDAAGNGYVNPELLLEVAAGDANPPQTDVYHRPASFGIEVNGEYLGQFRAPDAPADSRGALSYRRGLSGAYGYLMRIPLPKSLADALYRGEEHRFEIKLEIPDEECTGLAVFGQAAGRYPVGMTLVMQVR